ncbi:MAG: SNF2-related protein, partial [Planctomycetota bacterium]
GHPNVAWDDADAMPIDIFDAELTLKLETLQQEDSDVESEPTTRDGLERVHLRFRPRLLVNGLSLDPAQCERILGHTHPNEPVVVLIDRRHHRVVLCRLREPKATKLIQLLLKRDLSDSILDPEAAGKLALRAAKVDSMIRLELPDELAGPVEDVQAELVIELRSRVGAGLQVALMMHDDRFAHVLSPGHSPETVPCLTPEGPIRLKRDLAVERAYADQVVDRFGLERLSADGSYHWVAETDHDAIDLLGRLHAGGDETPRLIWPDGESLRVRGEITPSALRVQIDDGRDWFGLTGAISLDGYEVQLADLLSAVRDNRALVQVGDREFARISDAFRQRLRQLGDAVVADRGTLKVADAVVPAVKDLIGEDVLLEASTRWHDSIARLDELSDWDPEQPDGLDATLRDYQLEGYRWLARLSRWGVGGVLADDMGLGKTVQTLGALVDRGGDGPALIVAPTSVGDNWVRETQRFAPELNPLLYRDSDREQLINQAGPNDLVIVSYQLLQRDAKLFMGREWNTLVLDEAQFIKNAQTKTAQAIRKIEADWRIGLSGTPLENHLGELWSLMRTLSPGLLGSWERFRSRFAEPIERHHDDECRQSLARLVRPFILRRTKDKVLTELPLNGLGKPTAETFPRAQQAWTQCSH